MRLYLFKKKKKNPFFGVLNDYNGIMLSVKSSKGKCFLRFMLEEKWRAKELKIKGGL